MMRQLRLYGGLVVWITSANAGAQPTVSDEVAPAGASAGAEASAPASTPGTSGTTPPQVILYPNGLTTFGNAIPATTPQSNIAAPPRDGFELNGGGQNNAVRGSKGAFAITGDSARAIHVPDVHTVKRGDTLWDLCGHYLGNSWEWPRVWSYNPDIRNPNWIYPGDQIRIRSPEESTGGAYSSLYRGPSGSDGSGAGRGAGWGGSGEGSTSAAFGQPARVAPQTVFLRNEAYIEDPQKDILGEVIGAKEEQMLLGQGNHVYLDVKPGSTLKAGQELTLFEQSRKPEHVPGARQPPGEIILVKGTVEVEEFDAKKNLAKARIIESVDAIERGTKVGAVGRRYLVIPPKPSQVTVWVRLMTGTYPHVFLGQNQLVFLDHGSEDGLAPGNRLLVIRRGDTWRRSLDTNSKSARYRMRVDTPGNAESEPTQIKRNDADFPQEIVGEVRIVHTGKWSSLAVVTASQRELFSGDRAIARVGY
ncbi:MAG TPA: LysM peptidoglycan-binding domain-containing protein [Polyangiaceae bacterium]|nr:LysM peptidoglycan-binding domain-containing protein [Polyangiaceae bacterium]